jgi:hypothetical protein
MTLSLTHEISADHPYTFPERHTANLILIENAVNNLSSIITAISAAISNEFVEGMFSNTDLIAGNLTVIHNLNTTIPDVVLYNNINQQYVPDNITVIDENTVRISLNNFIPIAGDWTYSIGKAGGGSGTTLRETSSITVSGNYTIGTEPIVYVDTVNAVITVPPATSHKNQDFLVKYVNTGGTITLSGAAIDGQTVINITNQFKFKHFHSNGTAWYIIGEN